MNLKNMNFLLKNPGPLKKRLNKIDFIYHYKIICMVKNIKIFFS